MAQDARPNIDNLFSQYRLRKYAKGQILLLNGDKADYVYYLVAGRVKQYDVTYRGEEVILNIFKPPAFFPMSLAINNGTSSYIYEAETDIEIRQAPASEVVAFVKTNPEVAFDLLSRVYLGLDGLLGRMVHIMASNAQKRLIYELIIQTHRFGKKQANGSYTLDISEKELGSLAGLSRETVSREMHKLKAAELIEVLHSGILVKNLKALEKKLNKEA